MQLDVVRRRRVASRLSDLSLEQFPLILRQWKMKRFFHFLSYVVCRMRRLCRCEVTTCATLQLKLSYPESAECAPLVKLPALAVRLIVRVRVNASPCISFVGLFSYAIYKSCTICLICHFFFKIK